MPDPRPGEPRDDFVSRCIPVVLGDGTAEDNDQAVAICNRMWEDADKGLTIGELITVADQLLPSALLNPIMRHGTAGDLQAVVAERQKSMEHKTFSGLVTKADEEQGIVETVFAVMGNIDSGNDIIHPGAFAKTFAERGHKIRVLDNHRTDSLMRAIGKPLMLKEVNREDMPAEMLERHPGVTGGAFARIQLLMDTPEGKGAFIRLRDKAVDEWSFGYDALDTDFSTVVENGEEVNVRNLRTIKLYEISPVLFGMNEATTTLSAKAGDGNEERPSKLFGFPIVWTDKIPPIKDGDIVLSGCSAKADVIDQFRTAFGAALLQAEDEAIMGKGGEDTKIFPIGDGRYILTLDDPVSPERLAYIADRLGAWEKNDSKFFILNSSAKLMKIDEQAETAPPHEAAITQHDQAQAGPQDAPTSKELLELELLALETQTLEAT